MFAREDEEDGENDRLVGRAASYSFTNCSYPLSGGTNES